MKINTPCGICRLLWIKVVGAKLCTEVQGPLERNYLTESIFSICWLLTSEITLLNVDLMQVPLEEKIAILNILMLKILICLFFSMRKHKQSILKSWRSREHAKSRKKGSRKEISPQKKNFYCLHKTAWHQLFKVEFECLSTKFLNNIFSFILSIKSLL